MARRIQLSKRERTRIRLENLKGDGQKTKEHIAKRFEMLAERAKAKEEHPELYPPVRATSSNLGPPPRYDPRDGPVPYYSKTSSKNLLKKQEPKQEQRQEQKPQLTAVVKFEPKTPAQSSTQPAYSARPTMNMMLYHENATLKARCAQLEKDKKTLEETVRNHSFEDQSRMNESRDNAIWRQRYAHLEDHCRVVKGESMNLKRDLSDMRKALDDKERECHELRMELQFMRTNPLFEPSTPPPKVKKPRKPRAPKATKVPPSMALPPYPPSMIRL